MRLGKAVTAFSAFARPNTDLAHLTSKTLHGGIITTVGMLTGIILLISEITQFVYEAPTFELAASTELHALLPIHMDISFPRLPCALLSVDMADESGKFVSDSTALGIESMKLHKQRLSKLGKSAHRGDYKLPEPDIITIVGGMLISDSAQHMKDMEKELQDGEGCRLYGELLVSRMEGLVRLSTHVQDFLRLQSTRSDLEKQIKTAVEDIKAHHGVGNLEVHPDFSSINTTHHIHRLQFGPGYHGRISPLNGHARVVGHDYGSYRYYLTVVPTTFISAFSYRTRTFLYSVTEYFTPGSAHGGGEINVEKMPAVEFRIRMSPLATRVWYPQRQLGHFTTRLCAVLGGCVALTQFMHTLVHGIMKK